VTDATTDAPAPRADETDDAGAPAAAEPERLHGALVSRSADQQVLHVTREQYLDVLKALADDGFELCVDLCGVDYLMYPQRLVPDGITPERFEVVVNLVALAEPRRIRLRVQVPESDPTVPSLFDLWPGTEAMEREVFDLFGIQFEDHPDLTRILMPEDWIGHPLRKDYDTGRIPVQFKGAPEAR
jgi:NADH-quinone oxidoreductase subunit C